jgi:hypothetical protein
MIDYLRLCMENKNGLKSVIKNFNNPYSRVQRVFYLVFIP